MDELNKEPVPDNLAKEAFDRSDELCKVNDTEKIIYDKNGPHHKFIVLKTVVLVFAWITMGMAIAMVGPTTPDLRDRLGVDMETISLVLGAKSIGTPVGAIISGMLCDRYHRWTDVISCLNLALMSVCLVAKPNIYNLPLLAFICFFEGYGNGGMDAVGHAIIPWMWHDKAGPPMNAIHLGFPIGQALAPLIAVNFLKPQSDSENTTTIGETSTPAYVDRHINIRKHIDDELTSKNAAVSVGNPQNHSWLDLEYVVENSEASWNILKSDYSEYSAYPEYSTSVSTEQGVSRIQIPYGINAGLGLLVTFCLLLLYLYARRNNIMLYGKSKNSIKETFSPKGFRSSGTTSCVTVVIIVLVCFFHALSDSILVTVNPFIFSFATESHLGFTNEKASILETTYLSVSIFSRLMCTIISGWIPVEILLGVCACLYAISSVCLALLAPEDGVYLWVFMCVVQLFFSPLWPACIIWEAKYLVFSALIVGFVQLATGLTGFFCSWVAGYLYDMYPSGEFLLFGMSLALVAWLVWLTMQTLVSCNRRRNMTPNKTEVWFVDTGLQQNGLVNMYTESIYL